MSVVYAEMQILLVVYMNMWGKWKYLLEKEPAATWICRECYDFIMADI